MRFLTLITLFILASCASQKAVLNNSYINNCPPGTIQIDSNFYCDQTEVSNIDWREYEYWTIRVYGKNSKEHLSLLPDSLVWRTKDSTNNEPCVTEYYRHPKYNYLPVVGISQEQALNYSSWRADRIFEVLLVERKLIQFDSASTPESHFTINRYYNNEWSTYLSEKRLTYFPTCTLPTIEERQKVLHVVDSINLSTITKNERRKNQECLASYPEVISKETKNPFHSNYQSNPERRYSTMCNHHYMKIYNLRGGVSEIARNHETSFGGGWKDSRERIIKTDTFDFYQPNSNTGFRNVCRWVAWKTEKQ